MISIVGLKGICYFLKVKVMFMIIVKRRLRDYSCLIEEFHITAECYISQDTSASLRMTHNAPNGK